SYRRRRLSGLTFMEVLVGVAVAITVAAIVVPVVKVSITHSNKAATFKLMQDLGSATNNFCAQHDNQLPGEDAPGPTTWEASADPKNAEVWFNALPRVMGKKGVGDFSSNPASFYNAKENILLVPGAPYPTNDTRLIRPLFAIAF